MKKMNNRWQSVLLSLALFGLAACTGDFEDINRNPNQVTDDQMDALNYKTGTKFKALQSLVIPVQEHMYQFNESLSGGPFGGYIGATVDTWQTKFETYNPSADWRKWPFANVITETYTPYKGIVNGTEDEVAIAFARLLRVAIMHRVTDSYGPIPYSKLESNESVYVEYDSQEAVYTKMFEELDEAIEILGRNTTLPAEAWSRYDGVYYGNIAQWLKYANSLKLRMAMRLSYVKSDVARAKAAEAIAGGVIEANADNAAMHAAENRTTLIYNDWGDHRVGADILCYMNGYKDPRMEKMFLANDVGDYVGIRIGIDVTSKSQAVSKYSNMIVASDTPYLWFNAAEATFLRAEYELRWGSEETARSLYEAAVRLSFEERGASGADAYAVECSDHNAPTCEQFELAELVVQLLRKETKLNIPDGEIGFIAMHIHSARNQGKLSQTVKCAYLANSIVELIENERGIEIDRQALDYARFVTHVRFTVQRLTSNTPIPNELLSAIKRKYKESYALARKISKLIAFELELAQVPEGEIGYIALHIEKLCR